MKTLTSSQSYDEIGIVFYKRSSRAKRLIIRIKQDCTIHVSMPGICTVKQAETFVLSKKEWILSTLKTVKHRQPETTIHIEDTENITRFHNLIIRKNNYIRTPEVRIKSNAIIVTHPVSLLPESSDVQQVIRLGISKVLKKEAIQHITPRIIHFSKKHNLQFNKLCFRDNKTRWGSCSGKNNINLNIHLMKLPDELIDYVILHELAHIKHKNHSASFRSFLDNLLHNDSTKYDKALRKFRPTL